MAISDSVVAYWSFDSDMTDEVNSYDWTNSGTSDLAAGKISHARDFTPNDYAYLNSTKSLMIPTTNNDCSINVWINPDTTAGTTIIYDEHDSGGGGFIIRLSAGFINIWHDATATSGAIGISTGSWQMITITYDGTDYRLYVNGTLDSTSFPVTKNATKNTAANIYIGRYSHAASGYFTGGIDELTVWAGKTLTQAEITTIYNDGTGLQYPFTEAGTNTQINIGDVWKDVEGIQINIGDDWKEVF